MADYIENDDNTAGDDPGELPADEGKPPTRPSELESLDEAAGYKEINRLLEMESWKSGVWMTWNKEPFSSREV